MGSVFKKSFTKPIPAGAEVVVRQGVETARWRDSRGKIRTAPLRTARDGSRRITVRTNAYYARYRDAAGVVRERPTHCRDETAARQVLSDLERQVDRVRAGVVSASEVRVASNQAAPIEQHVASFLVGLEASGYTAKHVGESRRVLKSVLGGCEFRSLADLDRSKVEAWLNRRREAGASARTRNVDLITLMAFANWCCDPNIGRLSSNPFRKMKKADEKADPRRRRRSMTAAELTRLLEVARDRPLAEAAKVRRGARKGQAVAVIRPEVRERLRLLGRERALIYKTLVLSGLRKNELATLAASQLKFDDPIPHVQLDAADEKNREGNAVVIRADLVEDPRGWLADKLERARAECARKGVAGPDRLAGDCPVFTVPQGLIRIFDRDLKAAGIPKRDERGRTLDVHALRTTFGTLLSRGGVSLRTAQAAMRHSDPSLTANVYTDPKLLDVAGALDSLPGLPLAQHPGREAFNADRANPELAPRLAPKHLDVVFLEIAPGTRPPGHPPGPSWGTRTDRTSDRGRHDGGLRPTGPNFETKPVSHKFFPRNDFRRDPPETTRKST